MFSGGSTKVKGLNQILAGMISQGIKHCLLMCSNQAHSCLWNSTSGLNAGFWVSWLEISPKEFFFGF